MAEETSTFTSIDQSIHSLADNFIAAPHDFFSERDLHSRFAELARRRFGNAKTTDGYKVNLLRQEYNTVGRYSRSDVPPFGIRHAHQDRLTKAGFFDFAIIDPAFVRANDLLTVINKRDDPNRRMLSESCIVPFEAVIEFKMCHRARSFDITKSSVLATIEGIKDDARKCAHENPGNAFLAGFFHDWPFDENRTAEMKSEIEDEFRNYSKRSTLHLYLVSPKGII